MTGSDGRRGQGERSAAAEPTESVTLSTGQTVQVPLTLEARITGAVFSAPLVRLREMLPDGLRPLRVTPRRGAVTFLSVDYRRVGDDAMEPYDELSVQIPAVEGGTTTVPGFSGLWRCTSGYVWYMPVSTEPANALGREIWGYPKDVADISIEHGSSRTRTTVDVDGEGFLSMEVARPPTVSLGLTGYTYTEFEGRLVREKTELAGDVGFWPFSDEVSLEFGSHPMAEWLGKLELSGRCVLRLAADCEFTIHLRTPTG